MKRIHNLLTVGFLVISVIGFMGCEEGLTSNDGTSSELGDNEGTGFSFSDLYTRIKALEEETKRLRKVNEEQEKTIMTLSSSSSSSIGGLATRIGSLETAVGDGSGGLVHDVSGLQSTVSENVSAISSARTTASDHGSSISGLQST
ncbi:MAG: hypothetical protein GY754_41670, partial [bacterium]|nr:hypothetical protein [bacterium]